MPKDQELHLVDGNISIKRNGFISFDVIENKLIDFYLGEYLFLKVYKTSEKEGSTFLVDSIVGRTRVLASAEEMSELILYEVLHYFAYRGATCHIREEEYSVSSSILKYLKNLDGSGVMTELTSEDLYKSELSLSYEQEFENPLEGVQLNFSIRHGSTNSFSDTHIVRLDHVEFPDGTIYWTFVGGACDGHITFTSINQLSFLNNACVIMLGKLTKMGAVG